MFSTEQACRKHVYTVAKKGTPKKIGRVRAVVFHPNRAEVVGYIVKRPDLMLMFKRGDRFCAADRVEVTEDGFLVADEAGAWDAGACKRLGIDYDACLLWAGMPVKTEDGRALGAIKSVFYDEKTRKVDHLDISVDSVARTLLGQSEIFRDAIVGFKDGAIIVSRSIGKVEESGGVAAAAGEAWAKAKHAADRRADKAEKAIDKSARAVGRQVGKFPSMFKDFKDEFDKASRGE